MKGVSYSHALGACARSRVVYVDAVGERHLLRNDRLGVLHTRCARIRGLVHFPTGGGGTAHCYTTDRFFIAFLGDAAVLSVQGRTHHVATPSDHPCEYCTANPFSKAARV